MVMGSDLIGKEIGSYRLVDKLASGTFGCVYLARHTLLKIRLVAIKLMHAANLTSPQERERFLKEAQYLEMLKHRYILPIYDFGIYEGILPYMVVEYALNGSLRDCLKRQSSRPLPLEKALTILSQIGQALHYAHQQNVIHRDLKPENVLLNSAGEALIADFSIATMLATASIKLTVISGTPPYMAPEQFRGIISKKSDQYALGCIAYELVTGCKPFTAPDFIAMGFKHLMEDPVPPTQLNPLLPEHIEKAILKAMAKQRADRHPDVQAFISALRTPIVSSSQASSEVQIGPPRTSRKAKEQWLNEGIAYYKAKCYDEALAAYEQVIWLDPENAAAYYNKALTLRDLNRPEEALEACEKALRLDYNLADAYIFKSLLLCDLHRYEEALTTYDQVIQLNPRKSIFHYMKGIVFRDLHRYEEAIAAFECAIQLDPDDAILHYNQAQALYQYQWYGEALAAYEQAIQLDPNHPGAYHGKANVLKRLRRLEEAQQAYEKARRLRNGG